VGEVGLQAEAAPLGVLWSARQGAIKLALMGGITID